MRRRPAADRCAARLARVPEAWHGDYAYFDRLCGHRTRVHADVSGLSRVLADHRHGRAFMQDFLARNPKHPTEERVVDDRTFLLGLDELYRTGIKPHERTELLVAAREVASALGIPPAAADAPVEGYYGEDDQLREYF